MSAGLHTVAGDLERTCNRTVFYQSHQHQRPQSASALGAVLAREKRSHQQVFLLIFSSDIIRIDRLWDIEMLIDVGGLTRLQRCAYSV